MFLFSSLCLLCLNKNIETILIEDNEETLVKKKLNYCLPEFVDTYSEIPKYICRECTSKLDSFYDFKQTCLQNTANLKNYLETLTSTDEKHKHLTVSLTDMQEQNKQTLAIVENDQEEDNICIKEEIIVKTENNCYDLLDNRESRLLLETKEGVIVKEECVTTDEEYRPEFVRCGTFLSDSEVSGSINKDIFEDCIDSNSISDNFERNKCDRAPFKCTICNREYLHRISLAYHLKVHAGIKNLSCSICNKKFMHKSHLIEHEKIHTGIKNFQCSICMKKFLRKSVLIQHEVVHTDIKNFECLTCKKRFKFKHDLFRHESVHTGVKNFECTKCNRWFTQKSSLRTHERKNKACAESK